MVELEIGGRDILVLRTLMRQYWLWVGLTQPYDWRENRATDGDLARSSSLRHRRGSCAVTENEDITLNVDSEGRPSRASLRVDRAAMSSSLTAGPVFSRQRMTGSTGAQATVSNYRGHASHDRPSRHRSKRLPASGAIEGVRAREGQNSPSAIGATSTSNPSTRWHTVAYGRAGCDSSQSGSLRGCRRGARRLHGRDLATDLRSKPQRRPVSEDMHLPHPPRARGRDRRVPGALSGLLPRCRATRPDLGVVGGVPHRAPRRDRGVRVRARASSPTAVDLHEQRGRAARAPRPRPAKRLIRARCRWAQNTARASSSPTQSRATHVARTR